ncbi:aldo/keto reductase [Aeromicrobium senzhongii]|uniref:Aldo/keto reductase n=1 Tax=Aeromicrobium senzhongii TaxID=2663859 RepID=A0ABX6SP46_9ACTN|nr:aldo/keto reductase [Aeromicrobium senzhongii]MTB87042.1 aldo/keto reductase [Aeromicrobium senzhongii]QNL93138.1 aldo/keto reductase [Aeromicrobium senzhongii]
MHARRLGGSGLQVSRLGLGTMSWGAAVDEYVADEQLRVFLDAGGTLLDTAPIYGDGGCEQVIGSLLAKHGVRDRVVLAGKAGVIRRDGHAVVDGSLRSLMRQLDQSLADLGTDHLDLWQIHRWDDAVPVDETMAALDQAVRSGRVRYAGISNFTGWQTVAAQHAFTRLGGGVPLVSTQIEYSLVRRDPEIETIPAAEHAGMSVLAWSPLGRGVLTGKYRAGVPGDSRAADARWEAFVAPHLTSSKARVVDALAAAAQGLGVPVSHVALAWLRDRPQVGSAVVGARTTAQLQESLESETLELPPEIHAALSDVSEGAR